MTPRGRYLAAVQRVRTAQESCVHWDYHTPTDLLGNGEHECCTEHANALIERRRARLAMLEAEGKL